MNHRWQQLKQRVAFWLSPHLPRLLNKSLNVVERLEIKAERATAMRDNREDLERRYEMMAELREAAALADGAPWRAGASGSSYASRQLTEAANAIAKAPQETALKETIYGMAELEIALDDRGWKRLVAQSQYEFSRFGIQSIMLVCRLHRIKNPLAARAVDVSAFYVFGRGLEISSPDETANETLQDFFNDPRNASQFSHTALVKKEKATYTDGNIFFAFFADPQDGKLTARGIDATEVSDIITDPNDNDTPWFYRRDWAENTFDPNTGRREMKQRTQWYFAMGYEDIPGFPTKQRRIESQVDNVALDSSGQPIVVLHLKDGDLPGWRFGCPRMYCALDWLRAYKRGLEDLCTLWRALSRFAWNVETEGGAPAIAAFKQVLATTLANDLTQIESNPPPVTGSAFISGPTNKISPMQTGGSTMNPDNLRRVLLMVCAGFGLNENMMGDASTGSFATANSLQRDIELMFIERQEVWREVLQRIGRYVLAKSLRAPRGKLREAVAKRQSKETSEVNVDAVLIESPPTTQSKGIARLKEAKTPASDAAQKITVGVTFPAILQGDVKDRIAAITEALTLNGKEPIGIDNKVGFRLLLIELGVEDPDIVIEAMFPEATYEPDRTLEPALPTTIKADAAPPQSDAADRAGQQQEEPPLAAVSKDKEVVERAVNQILLAARKRLEQRMKEAAEAAALGGVNAR